MYYKKIVKVIEDGFYSNLFEIYKETKKVVLVKLVVVISLSGSYFSEWKVLLLVETVSFLGEAILFSGSHFF